MKIQNSNPAQISNLGKADHVSKGTSVSRPAVGGSDKKDHVQLSGLSNVLNSASVQHATKLASLSGDVSSGRYRVDSQILSDSIIAEHLRAAA